MLILSRKRGEQIVMPGRGLTLTVLGIAGSRVRVGITAPPDVTIRRAELSPSAVPRTVTPRGDS